MYLLKNKIKYLTIRLCLGITIALTIYSCSNQCEKNHETDKDATHQNTEMHDNKADDNHNKLHWSYEGEQDPEYLSCLTSEYSACAGKVQSPIDISSDSITLDKTLKELVLNYSDIEPALLNNGHTINVNYSGVSHLKNNDKNYNLKQFHFHCPSEHTINGAKFPMEIHLVNISDDNNISVVGLLVKEGTENQFLAKLWKHLPKKINEEKKASVLINAIDLLPEDKGYYNYHGSLTTPPCSEGVDWFVIKKPIEASAEQIDKIKNLMPKNNTRNIQALNNRVIKSSK